MPGFKYNMMDLQAAIGLHQLARLEDEPAAARGHLGRATTQAFGRCRSCGRRPSTPDRATRATSTRFSSTRACAGSTAAALAAALGRSRASPRASTSRRCTSTPFYARAVRPPRAASSRTRSTSRTRTLSLPLSAAHERRRRGARDRRGARRVEPRAGRERVMPAAPVRACCSAWPPGPASGTATSCARRCWAARWASGRSCRVRGTGAATTRGTRGCGCTRRGGLGRRGACADDRPSLLVIDDPSARASRPWRAGRARRACRGVGSRPRPRGLRLPISRSTAASSARAAVAGHPSLCGPRYLDSRRGHLRPWREPRPPACSSPSAAGPGDVAALALARVSASGTARRGRPHRGRPHGADAPRHLPDGVTWLGPQQRVSARDFARADGGGGRRRRVCLRSVPTGHAGGRRRRRAGAAADHRAALPRARRRRRRRVDPRPGDGGARPRAPARRRGRRARLSRTGPRARRRPRGAIAWPCARAPCRTTASRGRARRHR